jgi:hypothetical protein
MDIGLPGAGYGGAELTAGDCTRILGPRSSGAAGTLGIVGSGAGAKLGRNQVRPGPGGDLFYIFVLALSAARIMVLRGNRWRRCRGQVRP